VDWRPGLAAPATRFNFLDAPVLFEAARAAVGGEEAASRFAAAYPFDVRPATDARPYPHAFLGRRTLRLMFERGRGDWLPFAEWGYLAVLATLAQGAVLAALLLALPAIFVRSGAGGEHHGRLLWYFGALGLAYLLAEIAAIQQLTLLLGHPVYAVAAVLAAMLVGSGVGSAWSDRLAPARARGVALGLALACGALAVGLLPLVHAVEGAGLVGRALAAALVLGPGGRDGHALPAGPPPAGGGGYGAGGLGLGGERVRLGSGRAAGGADRARSRERGRLRRGRGGIRPGGLYRDSAQRGVIRLTDPHPGETLR
jgi:hypothetical protein